MIRCFLLAGLLGMLACVPVAQASNDTPVGTWRTIDDNTGKPTSIVKIYQADGKLEGKVVKVLESDQGPHPICKECEGERHNQPVEGMTIIWGVERDGEEWNGGQILDPDNGKTYDVKMSMLEGGSKLKVRGYIGWSLFGRSQVWERIQPDAVQGEAANTAPAAGTNPGTMPAAPATTGDAASMPAEAAAAAPKAARAATTASDSLDQAMKASATNTTQDPIEG